MFEESVRKHECEDSNGEVEELHLSKRGRTVLLGEKLDSMVRSYITE